MEFFYSKKYRRFCKIFSMSHKGMYGYFFRPADAPNSGLALSYLLRKRPGSLSCKEDFQLDKRSDRFL